jgi:hypothetical protein
MALSNNVSPRVLADHGNALQAIATTHGYATAEALLE